MRLAFMTFSCAELDWPAVCALARQHGFEGIEPRTGIGQRHGIEVAANPRERAAIRDTALRHDVTIACLATGRRFVGVPSVAAEIEAVHAEIDLAGDIGCARLRVFGGEWPSGLTRDDAISTVAAALRSLGDHAVERGVTVCIETHDGWCHPRDVAEVMQRCGHVAAAVNWDPLHTQRVGAMSPADACDILAPWVRHVHVHDGPIANDLAIWPIGTGAIDHRSILRLLHARGYNDFLSGEWIAGLMSAEAFADHLARESATLRGLLRELA